MKKLLSTMKGKILAIGAGAIVTAAVVVGVVLLLPKEDSYRSIAVNNLQGTTLIKSDKSEKEAYKGMHLLSGDDVRVQNEANLTLLLDADKYVYAQAGTHFQVECVDGEKSGKKVIHLMDGSVLNRLETALKEGEVYEVETPNATMAVRGTVFRVNVYRDEDGLVHTSLEVFDGKVQVDLRNENGDYNGVSETFEAGEAAAIIGNTEFAEFVTGEDDSKKQEIAYKQIPKDVAEVLVSYMDDGEELCIGKELLMDYTELAEHKMETITGKEATCTEDGYKEVWCTVCNEVTETITIPSTGHTLADWEIAQDPTCVKAGNRQRFCSVCKTYYEEEAIPATGHTAGEWETVREATCTEDSLSRKLCTVCTEEVETTTTAALGHSFGAWNVRSVATCTANGQQVRTCSRCGSEDVQTIAATGHNYGAWTEQTAATCTVNGSQIRTCSVCRGTETQAIVASGHQLKPTGGHNILTYDDQQRPTTVACIQMCIIDGCGAEIEVEVPVRTETEMTPDGIEIYTFFCSECDSRLDY